MEKSGIILTGDRTPVSRVRGAYPSHWTMRIGGPTQIRTGIARFKAEHANHYTMGPKAYLSRAGKRATPDGDRTRGPGIKSPLLYR